MTENARRLELEQGPSFPAFEPPSFFSRPTPVVPAPDQLGTLAADTVRPGRRRVSSLPDDGDRASSRPTWAPDLVSASSLSESPCGSCPEVPRILVGRVLNPLTPFGAPFRSRLSSVPEAPVAAPALAVPDVRAARRPRRALAACLFLTLFGGVVALLGYAVQQQLREGADVRALLGPAHAASSGSGAVR